MTRAGAIDLGTLPREPTTVDETPAPPPHVRRRHRRVAALVLIAALLVVTSTASAAQPPPWLVPHVTVPYGAFALSADTMYVAVPEQVTVTDVDGGVSVDVSGPEVLRAYRLSDGAIRWEAPLPGHALASSVSLLAGTPVVIEWRDGTDQMEIHSTLFDRDTGRTMWTGEGAPLAITGGNLLLRQRVTSAYVGRKAEIRDLAAFDIATGRTTWALTLSGRPSELTPDGRHLVQAHADGRFASYDLTRGSRVATGGEVGSRERWRVTDTLVVTADRGTVTAYDVATLQQRWVSNGLPADSDPVPCGPVVCLSAAGGAPRALDPADGSVLWTADWFDPADAPVALLPSPLPGDDYYVLLALDSDGPDRHTARQWLVDPLSGQPVADLSGWFPDRLSFAEPLKTDQPVLLPYRYDESSDTTWLGQVRADAPGVDVRHRVDGRDLCQTAGGYAVCLRPGAGARDQDPHHQIWRLRR